MIGDSESESLAVRVYDKSTNEWYVLSTVSVHSSSVVLVK